MWHVAIEFLSFFFTSINHYNAGSVCSDCPTSFTMPVVSSAQNASWHVGGISTGVVITLLVAAIVLAVSVFGFPTIRQAANGRRNRRIASHS